jgi:hypothetical protein
VGRIQDVTLLVVLGAIISVFFSEEITGIV